MKRNAIIVDLDGTLYDSRERQQKHLLTAGKKDFDGFHADAHHDKPNFWCAQLIKAMHSMGFISVFTSGRDDTYRQETETWIKRHLNWEQHQYKLFMRPAKDYTADDVMKAQCYQELIEPHFTVLFAIDDRKRVVDMWRNLGLTCLHCAEGNF